MIIGERLQLLRKERALTKKELVATVPLNYSTYANYESGFREPNSEILQMLSQYYNVSIDFIMGLTDNRKKADEIAVLTDEEHEHITHYRALDAHGKDIVDCILQKEYERIHFSNDATPITQNPAAPRQPITLSVYQQRASAGLGNYLGDDSYTHYEKMQFPATPASTRADFAIRIKGDSMEPKIRDGDIVFIKAMPQIDTDSIGIFVYEGEAYCKKLRVDNKKGVIFLDSLNKSYAPRQIQQPENLRTIGLVIGVAEPEGTAR